jgi:hypothetical protein
MILSLSTLSALIARCALIPKTAPKASIELNNIFIEISSVEVLTKSLDEMVAEGNDLQIEGIAGKDSAKD